MAAHGRERGVDVLQVGRPAGCPPASDISKRYRLPATPSARVLGVPTGSGGHQKVSIDPTETAQLVTL
jgi:hypothetical protein